MFRSMSGFKAQFGDLTLLVVAEFDEWRVYLLGTGVVIQGTRQFTEAKAKQHAVDIARNYVGEEKCNESPLVPTSDWAPMNRGEWLTWT
jgi:hypothetical protein